QLDVANCDDSGSIITACTPCGISKSLTSLYAGNSVAFFMNSAQIGAAVAPPASPRSRLSSNPIQITVTRFEVYPANQPSRDVPVFPAAGNENPRARTVAPVPLFKTSINKLVTR